MKYLVNAIEFDFSDSIGVLDTWEQEQIVKNNLGVWEADDDDDLIDEITTGTGWCIKSIDFMLQLKYSNIFPNYEKSYQICKRFTTLNYS